MLTVLAMTNGNNPFLSAGRVWMKKTSGKKKKQKDGKKKSPHSEA